MEGDPLLEAKHGLLVGKSIVERSKKIPVKVINTSMWSNKIYAGIRFANLSSLVMENLVEIYTVHKNEENIEKLISNSIDSNESIIKLDENQNLKSLLIKY